MAAANRNFFFMASTSLFLAWFHPAELAIPLLRPNLNAVSADTTGVSMRSVCGHVASTAWPLTVTRPSPPGFAGVSPALQTASC